MCPWSIFLMNFNTIFKTLKFMKSCTKSIITKKVFVYLGFNVAFNTVQVISRRVVGRAEETST